MEKHTSNNSNIDIRNVGFNDKDTWDLICSGQTKGVFQLESSLGRSWAKKVKPRNLEELSALLSIIRPGTLKAIVDGKSMTQHYVDRKDGDEEIEYLHESLEPILKSTQGVLVYQEQSMQIAQKLAGFSLEEADNLRKAIGKKKASLMAEVKKDFIKGAKKVDIIKKDVAEEIFSWIEKSSRYAFNKSHAVSYAICGYWSAYCKAHFPKKFYASWLSHAHAKPNPQEEVKELISDARLSDIYVFPPSLNFIRSHTSLCDEKIRFGFLDVKSVGKSHLDKIRDVVDFSNGHTNKNVEELNWFQALCLVLGRLPQRPVTAMIHAGVFMFTGIARNKMLADLSVFNALTNKEKEWAQERWEQHESLESLLEALCPTKKQGGGTSTKKRSEFVKSQLDSIKNPMMSMEDDPIMIIRHEEEYLGTSISYSKVRSSENYSIANTSCKDIVNGKKGNVTLAVNLSEIRKYTSKKGKNVGRDMAFLKVEDSSGTIDNVVVFHDAYEEHKHIMYEGNNLLLVGRVDTNNKQDSVVVDNVKELD